jgi:hypothetical protein
VVSPDVHGQAQLFKNQALIDGAVVPPDVVPFVESLLAPAQPTDTPRVLRTPTRSLLSQANRNWYWQKLMQGTLTHAIRRQRDRCLEAIAKAKAQESPSRVRAALETTTDPVQQTPVPSPIVNPDLRSVGDNTIGVNTTPAAPVPIDSPNFGQAKAPATGVINILGPLIDSGLAGDVSLLRTKRCLGCHSSYEADASTSI